MKSHIVKNTIYVFALLFLLTINSYAQGNFVYTNNELITGNTVSGFSVAANGTLTPLPNSPFLTGGIAFSNGFLAANRIITSPSGNLLFASNNFSQDISVFSINPTTGSLTLTQGSPFSFPIVGVSIGSGISLAATPDGKFLIAADTGSGNIQVYDINPMGALTLIPGSLVLTKHHLDGIKIAPNGKFLAVAIVDKPGGILIFNIGGEGLLTPVSGSPFPTPPDGFSTVSLDINCESSLLFSAQGTSSSSAFATIINVFNISPVGALTPISGSPFSFASDSDATAILLSPDDKTLFVSNVFNNNITVLNVMNDGGLSLTPGSPFASGGFSPTGLATNQEGSFLFTANHASNSISVFSVADNGNLNAIPGSPFNIGLAGGVRALAAFPLKSCFVLPIFDLCIQDDSSANIFKINTTTGAYQLVRCRDGFSVTGTGTLSKRGCTIGFQDSRSDRRILASIDTCSNRATASVQIFAQGSIFTLTDRNTVNNTCSCPQSQ